MDDQNTVDAVQAPIVEEPSSETIQTAEVAQESEKTPVVAEQEKQAQSQEENSKWAEMRRQNEQYKAQLEAFKKDQEIASQYGEYGIYTVKQYEEALARQQAEEMGLKPEVFSKLQTMEQELQTYKQKEARIKQQEELSKDTVKGEFYGKWKSEIDSMAENFNIDLDAAFALTLTNKLAELKPQPINEEEIKANAIKEYVEKLKTSQQPVEHGGTSATKVVSAPKTWKDAFAATVAQLNVK